MSGGSQNSNAARMAVGLSILFLSLPILIILTNINYDNLNNPNSKVDLDGDSIDSGSDFCEDGITGWTSDSTTDYDSDGCKDALGFGFYNSLTSNDNSNSHDWPSSVTDSLGNTYVTGSSEEIVSLSGTEYGPDMYLMKVNSEGDILWNRSLESESTSQGYINNILIDEYSIESLNDSTSEKDEGQAIDDAFNFYSNGPEN